MTLAARRSTALLALLSVLGAGLAAPVARAEDEWRFALAPYLWLPTIEGQMNYELPPGGGGSPNVSVGPSHYLPHLKFALMVAGEVRRERWALGGDLIYLDLGAGRAKTVSVTLPDGLVVPVIDAGTTSSLRGTVLTVAPAYRFVETANYQADAFAGARYLAVRGIVDWRIAGPVGAFPKNGTVDQKKAFTDAVVGVRGRYTFVDSRWSMPYYLDIGTGATRLTTQAALAASYAYSWGEVSLGYRYLKYEVPDNKLVSSLSLGGPQLTALFRF